jgi:hypothetical protein
MLDLGKIAVRKRVEYGRPRAAARLRMSSRLTGVSSVKLRSFSICRSGTPDSSSIISLVLRLARH